MLVIDATITQTDKGAPDTWSTTDQVNSYEVTLTRPATGATITTDYFTGSGWTR